MNSEDANKWKASVLKTILFAMASAKDLDEVLIYKGAIILDLLLRTKRMSLDLDSNLAQDFTIKFPERDEQERYLEETLFKAISRYFNRQDPVRYELTSLRIKRSPPKEHPRGWNAFSVILNVIDHENANVRGLPALNIDIAAPEKLTKNSIAIIELGSRNIQAYTLKRMAGEKLRAFLSTLPLYRKKVQKPGEAVRVKDLYDLVRIIRAKPIADEEFWGKAGEEFKLACESRFIDCSGIECFQENWQQTQEFYENDPTIPDDVSFDEVNKAISEIMDFFSKKGLTPFTYTLPQ